MKSDNRIKVFFEQVEQASNTLDLNLIDSQFADQFIFADPNGTRVVENGNSLRFSPSGRNSSSLLGINPRKFCRSMKLASMNNTRWSKRIF
jgi:hypothetical protein